MQNTAARLVASLGKFDHITLILACLHWLPVMSQVTFKVVVLTYKGLHGLGSNYLAEHHNLECDQGWGQEIINKKPGPLTCVALQPTGGRTAFGPLPAYL